MADTFWLCDEPQSPEFDEAISAKLFGDTRVASVALEFDESKHPRVPAGSGRDSGRFGSAGGGPADAVAKHVKGASAAPKGNAGLPTGWTRTTGTAGSYIESDLRAILDPKDVEADPSFIANQVAQAGSLPDIIEYANADRSVVMRFNADTAATQAQQAAFAKVADDLRTTNPVASNISINVIGTAPASSHQIISETSTGPKMNAMVFGNQVGKGTININDLVFSPDGAERAGKTIWNDIGPDVTPAQYTLTHEYGHVIDGNGPRGDRTDNSKVYDVMRNAPAVSPYGEQNPKEAYAEAFAAYKLDATRPGSDQMPRQSVLLAELEGWKQ